MHPIAHTIFVRTFKGHYYHTVQSSWYITVIVLLSDCTANTVTVHTLVVMPRHVCFCISNFAALLALGLTEKSTLLPAACDASSLSHQLVQMSHDW